MGFDTVKTEQINGQTQWRIYEKKKNVGENTRENKMENIVGVWFD